MPPGQTGKVVGAQQQHKNRSRVLPTQKIESGAGVTGARQGKLGIGSTKARVANDGQLHKVQANGFGQQVGGVFKRVVRRHHQPHLIEVGPVGKMLGQDKVPGMNGVEGAKKQADAGHCC